MNARTNPFSVIRCGNADDAYRAHVAMFRYAFGRQTGMPSTIINLIKRNEKDLTDRTLNHLDQELTEEAERYDRVYAGNPEMSKHGTNYGMEFNRKEWLAFHEWVKEQISKRKEGAK